MYLLIDIGGTKTRMTITEHKEAFIDPSVFRTCDEFEAWIHEVRNKSIELTHGRKIKGVVVGIPGKFSNDGVLENLTNLKKWNGVPLKQRLESIFSCPISMENDAALVGLGEAVYGAGKGHSIVAYHTISTGVNGVRIVDGKIDRNTFGFEIGHTIISDGHDVESLISGGALERRFGKPSHEIHDVHFWEKINHYAGIFGANTAMYWSPSIIIYGGPVMNDLHISIIEKEAKAHLVMYKEHPLFVRGTLGDFGGLYGGLAMLKHFEK